MTVPAGTPEAQLESSTPKRASIWDERGEEEDDGGAEETPKDPGPASSSANDVSEDGGEGEREDRRKDIGTDEAARDAAATAAAELGLQGRSWSKSEAGISCKV
eukprot:TRINITY_DN84608_c0_g1_i1.p2 TRINITY_DN84608_c0_g1~~TRINITY_DN84608_c0_g1_i1.p2  ORF type:complete len:104 (-),score=19.53 TRINITY_DN84608_c0_g1_i1:209-520(-)